MRQMAFALLYDRTSGHDVVGPAAPAFSWSNRLPRRPTSRLQGASSDLPVLPCTGSRREPTSNYQPPTTNLPPSPPGYGGQASYATAAEVGGAIIVSGGHTQLSQVPQRSKPSSSPKYSSSSFHRQPPLCAYCAIRSSFVRSESCRAAYSFATASRRSIGISAP